MKDSKIIQHLRESSYNKAAEGLYTHFVPISRIVIKAGGDLEDAKDLFQEAVLVLMRKVVEENQTIQCSLKTYLATICKYQWNNKINSLAHRQTTIGISRDCKGVESDWEAFEAEELRYGHLNLVLSAIGEKCQELLDLFYVKRQSMSQIAELMSFGSVDSAKTQKYKCLEKAKNLATQLSSTDKV